ncbi:MAG: BatD family protein [Candidatus Omnitrophica bacterium]|nr:BatD family protein [Candidatus Omnitrophota bacterium]
MNYLLIFIFSIFMFFAQTAVFADTTIKAEVDKPVVTMDELLTYKLTVASTEKNIPSPKIPELKSFSIVSQAQSSTVSFVQGGMQTVLVFAFILLPKETGKIKIEPAQVTVVGKVYSSQACQIEVKQGISKIQPGKRSKIPLPEEPAGQEEPGPEIPDSGQPQYNI